MQTSINKRLLVLLNTSKSLQAIYTKGIYIKGLTISVA